MLIHVLDENVLQNRGMIVFLVIAEFLIVKSFAIRNCIIKEDLDNLGVICPIGLHHTEHNWATRHLIGGVNEW